ncbi:MAG: Y-family DNA polymerase [Candidatus Dojkabacteria bacterium]|nr:MAG: Y-family DNA polymerase [Candidatus Dojkabacteria bacterium]
MRSIGLVDCNNFFVSCERAFNPKFKDRPVLVLSNNDGCVVARSNEVRQLNIPMGVPYYQVEALVKKHNVKVFSSNYPLYIDMSRRVLRILKNRIPKVEFYSIDEAFLDLEGYNPQQIGAQMRSLRADILTWTGIPVSIGVAATKTLAKIGSEVAKKNPELGGCVDFGNMTHEEQDCVLESLPVSEVWGVGRQLSKKYEKIGVDSVLDLKRMDGKTVRKMATVAGYRTWLELNGTRCFEVHQDHSYRESIAYTRSFGYKVTRKEEILESVAFYAASASEKLRRQGCAASSMYLFLIIKNSQESQHKYSTLYKKVNFQMPSFETQDIAAYATQAASEIFRPGYRYKKAGVCLYNIVPLDSLQLQLWGRISSEESVAKRINLNKYIDSINLKWGRGAVRIASEGVGHRWKMKSESRSPSYTTEWNELLTVS